MRLWHYKLLPYLPKSQLLAQKRECDLIWKDYKSGKKTNHILINYIHDYSIDNLYMYYRILEIEFKFRGFAFKDNSPNCVYYDLAIPFKNHHNNEYLTICYYNLKEKYLRGQKDFTDDVWNKLEKFYLEKK